MADRAKSHMGGSKPHKSHGDKPTKSHGSKPHEVHVRRAHGGGYIVKHHHKPDASGIAPESEEHVVPDADQLQAHIQDAMGDQPPAGTPMQAPAPAGPAPGAAPMGM
jgi:hypothetical protein